MYNELVNELVTEMFVEQPRLQRICQTVTWRGSNSQIETHTDFTIYRLNWHRGQSCEILLLVLQKISVQNSLIFQGTHVCWSLEPRSSSNSTISQQMLEVVI